MSDFSIVILIILIVGSSVFIPQGYAVLKSKSTKGLSIVSYTAYSISLILWSLYAAFIGNITNYAINRVVFLTSIPIYYYLFKNIGKPKYFIYYLTINLTITMLSIIMITTRLLNIWGPIIGSSDLNDPRPIWFISISWILSMVGAVISATSFLPQVIKSIKSKHVKMHIGTMIILCVTQTTWCAFWITSLITTHPSLGEWLPGLLAASFTATLQMILIFSWIIFKEYKKTKVEATI